jgi:acyl-CoA reductase-like NAD-dependent aldehyde dehydrogenase
MLEHRFVMMIGGRARPGAAQRDILNPATAEVVARAPDCSADELDQAVAAARAAFATWRDVPIGERQAKVAGIAKILIANKEELAHIFTLEMGRPRPGAEAEVLGAAQRAEGAATIAPETRIVPSAPDRRVEIRRVPLGVVACIIPWNFPLLLAVQKIAPALVAGCTVVVKPSPFTPLTMLRLAELLGDLFPPGVLNVVSGGDTLGPMLTAHPGIDKISFTGSTATGKKVMESASRTLTRVTLELGGNDPAIVMPDVDIATVVPKLFWGAFYNSAQFCLATKRLYIHEDIYAPLSSALVDYARGVAMGNGMDEGVMLGPIQNAPQYRRVAALVEAARQRGLNFLFEGARPEASGYFIPVTIIDNPPEDDPVVTDEAFGPVLPLLKFSDIDDVVARANASPYGLGASIWCRDGALADAIATRIDAGTIWINEIHQSGPFLTIAGRKQSGIGVENGIDGMLEYTAVKAVSAQLLPAS